MIEKIETELDVEKIPFESLELTIQWIEENGINLNKVNVRDSFKDIEKSISEACIVETALLLENNHHIDSFYTLVFFDRDASPSIVAVYNNDKALEVEVRQYLVNNQTGDVSYKSIIFDRKHEDTLFPSHSWEVNCNKDNSGQATVYLYHPTKGNSSISLSFKITQKGLISKRGNMKYQGFYFQDREDKDITFNMGREFVKSLRSAGIRISEYWFSDIVQQMQDERKENPTSFFHLVDTYGEIIDDSPSFFYGFKHFQRPNSFVLSLPNIPELFRRAKYINHN